MDKAKHANIPKMQIDYYLPLQSTSNHNPVFFDVIFNEDRILAHA